MAHNLSKESGRVEMAYSGATPWHGLGTQVDGLKTAEGMLQAAGMDWTVSTRKLHITQGQEGWTEVPSHVAIARDDTNRVLGVATARYRPIQNSQAGEIVQAILDDGALCEVAGVLGHGERCWILARVGESFEVTKGDEVKPYFLLAWGHDGKHGVAGKMTPVRVVCQNTLGAAGFGEGKKWSQSADIFIRHYGELRLRLDEARNALGIAKRQAGETAAVYRAMATTSLGKPSDYFKAVFPEPSVPEANAPRKEHETYSLTRQGWIERHLDLHTQYQCGAGAHYAPGSVWNAYNAVTEWTDHIYPVLANGTVSATRQQSVAFGAYAGIKDRALTEAISLI